MSSLLRLERKQKNSSNPFRIRIFLRISFTFGIETINTFIHSRSSLENHTRSQTKMGKICTRFLIKRRKNPTRSGGRGAHTHKYIAHIREFPLPGLTRFNGKRQELNTHMFNRLQRQLLFLQIFLSNFIYTPVLYIPSLRIWGDIPPFHDSILTSFNVVLAEFYHQL